MTSQVKVSFSQLEVRRYNVMAERMVDQIGVGPAFGIAFEHRLSAEDAIWTALRARVESVYAREAGRAVAGARGVR